MSCIYFIFNDVHEIRILIIITGYAYIISGIMRVIAGLYNKQSLPKCNFICYADEIGLYGEKTNNGLMILAFINEAMLLFVGSKDFSSSLFPTIVSGVFIIWTSFGALYRRMMCILVNEEEIILSKWNKNIVYKLQDISGYTNCLLIGGYKAIGIDNKTIFKWATFWGEGRHVCDYLDSKNIKYISKK
jgi:hypothetical protein